MFTKRSEPCRDGTDFVDVGASLEPWTGWKVLYGTAFEVLAVVLEYSMLLNGVDRHRLQIFSCEKSNADQWLC